MTKPQIAVTNDMAWTLQQINDLYTQGKLKGLTVQMMLTDNECVTAHAGELSFIEKLGLIESAKQSMTFSANGLI